MSGKGSCAPSSRRTLTGCIRPRAASASLSCTVRSTAAAAPDAASPCPEEAVNTGEGVTRCSCGGVLRPEVVLYEEPLAERDITDAVNFIRKADVLIVGGTSLAVYPAAGRCAITKAASSRS